MTAFALGRLRKLAEYQSAVMNNMAEGLYALDANGLLTSINPAAEAILGWKSGELIGKKMHDLTHYKHPDGSPFPASDCPGLQVMQKGISLREHEDTFIRKDGSFVPVVFSASPLKEDGRIAGVIVSFRDDTEQRRAREALLDSREQLSLALHSSRTAMFDWDLVTLRGKWNRKWLTFTGSCRAETTLLSRNGEACFIPKTYQGLPRRQSGCCGVGKTRSSLSNFVPSIVTEKYGGFFRTGASCEILAATPSE